MAQLTIEYGAVQSLDAYREYTLAAAYPGAPELVINLERRSEDRPADGWAGVQGKRVPCAPWWSGTVCPAREDGTTGDPEPFNMMEAEILRRVNLRRALAALASATYTITRERAHPSGSVVLWEGVGSVRTTHAA